MKIGLVNYLNILPLVHYLKGYNLIYDVPSKLSERFNNGEIDSAILPVYEVLQHENLFIIDNLSISSRHESASVLLFFNKQIKEIKRVALDTSSQSSYHLLQLLLLDYYQLDCTFEPLSPNEVIDKGKSFDAYLLIGNSAIEHRKEKENFLDLAQLWHEWTELPFVFAVWVVREKNEKLKHDLLDAKTQGLNNLHKIIEESQFPDPKFLLNYYQTHLHYDLGDSEKKSIALYQNKLNTLGFLNKIYQLNYY